MCSPFFSRSARDAHKFCHAAPQRLVKTKNCHDPRRASVLQCLTDNDGIWVRFSQYGGSVLRTKASRRACGLAMFPSYLWSHIEWRHLCAGPVTLPWKQWRHPEPATAVTISWSETIGCTSAFARYRAPYLECNGGTVSICMIASQNFIDDI